MKFNLELREHHSQLGDMKLSCPCPVWFVEDTETLEMKFNLELGGKKSTGNLLNKILEILAAQISVEHHSLNTILEHPTLGFDLQKQHACESLKPYQVCIYDR